MNKFSITNKPAYPAYRQADNLQLTINRYIILWLNCYIDKNHTTI